MNMFLYVVIIPIAMYLITSSINRRYKVRKNTWPLALVALLFSASLFLPSPVIEGSDTEFWTHFFGGGVFIGLLCLYFRPLIKRKITWYQEFFLLFAAVSTFGVMNELYELLALHLGIYHESLDDTSWDLLANTLGALTFFIIYKMAMWCKTLFISR
ncbi:hypothetical protein EYC58_05360 [Candidatus Saccharibacteria bacterium]|nr:MAG: hypothetical protein EYC58_05360 [Candidatus Saccharibacteria bacterium]